MQRPSTGSSGGPDWCLQRPCCTSPSWRSNWTYRGPVTMPTYRAMRWKLSGPEPTGPWSPYHHAFPRRPPACLLTVSKRSSADSLGAFFLFLCVLAYIYIILFPWVAKIWTDECCKTIQKQFDLNHYSCIMIPSSVDHNPGRIPIPVAPECRDVVGCD
jgi:hypothetical protein